MHALQLVMSLSFCFRLPEVLRIFDYQSDELMSNLLTELERVKQEGENYWLSKVRCLFIKSISTCKMLTVKNTSWHFYSIGFFEMCN